MPDEVEALELAAGIFKPKMGLHSDMARIAMVVCLNLVILTLISVPD